MQISSFTSAAFGTFKDLATAAVTQEDAPAPVAADPAPLEKPMTNQRQGVSLDAYA
jgi:hypothetical protein